VRKIKNIVDWFVCGKDGRVHVIQIPNVLLIGWLVFMITAQLVAESSARTGLSHLSQISLAIWSYLEITQGASRCRRVLGAVVATVMVYSFFT